MDEHLVPKMINLCVVKLSNSWAKAGPMSGAQPVSAANALAEASAVGLACVPRLDLDYLESQADSPRLDQKLPSNFE
jgi:hypothetical protein